MAGAMNRARLPGVAELVGDHAVPPWLDAAALRGRAAASLPSPLTRELWKYTPLPRLLESLASAAPARLADLSGADQPGIDTTPLAAASPQQQARARRAVLERLDGGRHALADLSLLRADSGWLIEVRGRVAAALEIHCAPHGIAPVVLLLEPGAELTLVEPVHGDGFLGQVLLAELGAGARLTHYRSALQKDVAHYSLLDVHVGHEASYALNSSLTGGRQRRAEVHVVLRGAGASAELSGAYLVEDGQHLDQQLVVEHLAARTFSRQKFHGVGAGRGRSIFNGRIHIHHGAPGSDAALSNRNLALHADAEMNTKPELEIYTDDVRCAHGATVGQLSPDATLYLQSRGIPAVEARRLLAHGFVRECLAGPLADVAATRFREALA